MSSIQSAPAVVVGVDGSRAAIHAALWAVDEAISRDIPLRLVHVIDPLKASGVSDDGNIVARWALFDARRAVEATGKPVKIDTELGLNHACRIGGTVAAALAGSALCPVAVIHRPMGASTGPKVSAVVAQVDNGVVLRHAFEEARLRGIPVRVIGGENDSAQAQLNRRIASWTRLYPDVQVEPTVVCEARSGQLFVIDSHTARDLSSAHSTGCSMLTVPCGNL
jgi:nucleotide-binding universal stress UspA family protein